jgi:hypothetical protein
MSTPHGLVLRFHYKENISNILTLFLHFFKKLTLPTAPCRLMILLLSKFQFKLDILIFCFNKYINHVVIVKTERVH